MSAASWAASTSSGPGLPAIAPGSSSERAEKASKVFRTDGIMRSITPGAMQHQQLHHQKDTIRNHINPDLNGEPIQPSLLKRHCQDYGRLTTHGRIRPSPRMQDDRMSFLPLALPPVAVVLQEASALADQEKAVNHEQSETKLDLGLPQGSELSRLALSGLLPRNTLPAVW